MFVCVCNKVTDHQIREACDRGCNSLQSLKDELKVATCCGRCQDCAHSLLRSCQMERFEPPAQLAAGQT